MPGKPLAEHTEEELRAFLAKHTENVVFAYNDIVAELERRRQQRNADRVFRLSIIALIISVISLFGSLLTALLK